jgi:hypothetical protein
VEKMNGWVKLHRQVLENKIFRHDRTAWHVFETLLLICNKKNAEWSGGRNQLADLCNEKAATTYKALKRLEKAEMVTLSSNNRFTTIHICKWKEYQGSGNSSGNNKVTTKYQQSNTLTRIENRELRSSTTYYGNEKDVSSLFYKVIKAYELPVKNHNTIRSAISKLQKETDEESAIVYLKFLLEQYPSMDFDYKPQISEALDIYSKRVQIINAVKATARKHKKKGVLVI